MAKSLMAKRQSQWRELVEHQAPLSVTIYMPTHVSGADIRQDPIRLRNCLDDAERQLIELGERAPNARARLADARALVDDSDFWRHQRRGLGLFISDGATRRESLPFEPQPMVSVAEQFHLKPLFDLQARPRFYILGLSKNAVHLYRCNGQTAEAVPLPGAPRDFAEQTRAVEVERQMQWHTQTAPHAPGGTRPAFFHGQGEGGDESVEKKRVMEYCHEIDVSLNHVLTGERRPLLLAAAEPINGLYRRGSAYPSVDPRPLAGCPDEMPVEELHRRAAALLEGDRDEAMQAAADRYYIAAGAGQGVHGLRRVVEAASRGGVDTLFVAGDEACWGTFDFESERLIRHDEAQPGDVDLLNFAAVLTERNGGAVYVVPRERIPDGAVAAAALRFRG